MINFMDMNKMPITRILLFFSYLIVSCGAGIAAGGLWLLFRFKDIDYFIFGLVVLVFVLFIAALVRMFANMGQLMFDLHADAQRSLIRADEFDRKLNQQLRTFADRLDNSFRQANELDQRLNQELRNQLQLQADSLVQESRSIFDKLENIFARINELEKIAESVKNIFVQMDSDSKDVNQNIRQIKTFFERIEKHLDLKK